MHMPMVLAMKWRIEIKYVTKVSVCALQECNRPALEHYYILFTMSLFARVQWTIVTQYLHKISSSARGVLKYMCFGERPRSAASKVIFAFNCSRAKLLGKNVITTIMKSCQAWNLEFQELFKAPSAQQDARSDWVSHQKIEENNVNFQFSLRLHQQGKASHSPFIYHPRNYRTQINWHFHWAAPNFPLRTNSIRVRVLKRFMVQVQTDVLNPLFLKP